MVVAVDDADPDEVLVAETVEIDELVDEGIAPGSA